MTTRGRVLAGLWLIAGAAIWCGVFDLLITRGAKEYLMRQAQHDAGQGPAPDMSAIMRQTAHDATIESSYFAVPVTALGWLTIAFVKREDRK